MDELSKKRLNINNMALIKQGEKLMLLVRRDRRSTEEIAEAMGIDKSYLPRLYKMDVLPPKPLRSAAAVFQVPESYFLEVVEIPDTLAEPQRPYGSAVPTDELERLRAENEHLRAEIARLARTLEQEKSLSADLAEALKNLSKRG